MCKRVGGNGAHVLLDGAEIDAQGVFAVFQNRTEFFLDPLDLALGRSPVTGAANADGKHQGRRHNDQGKLCGYPQALSVQHRYLIPSAAPNRCFVGIQTFNN